MEAVLPFSFSRMVRALYHCFKGVLNPNFQPVSVELNKKECDLGNGRYLKLFFPLVA